MQCQHLFVWSVCGALGLHAYLAGRTHHFVVKLTSTSRKVGADEEWNGMETISSLLSLKTFQFCVLSPRIRKVE